MKSYFCADVFGATESKTIKDTYTSLPWATNKKQTQQKRKQMALQVPWRRSSRSHLVGGEENLFCNASCRHCLPCVCLNRCCVIPFESDSQSEICFIYKTWMLSVRHQQAEVLHLFLSMKRNWMLWPILDAYHQTELHHPRFLALILKEVVMTRSDKDFNTVSVSD